MNLKQIAQKLSGYIKSKTEDDKGFIQQGKFTTQPVKTAIQNWQQKPSNTLWNQGVSNFKQNVKQIPTIANNFLIDQQKKIEDTPVISASPTGTIGNIGTKMVAGMLNTVYNPQTKKIFPNSPLRSENQSTYYPSGYKKTGDVKTDLQTTINYLKTSEGRKKYIEDVLPLIMATTAGMNTNGGNVSKESILKTFEKLDKNQPVSNLPAVKSNTPVQIAPQSTVNTPSNIASSVVQVVNQKTGAKSFFTIPKNQLEQVKSLIDSQDGIAGEVINNQNWHITAKTPEQMSKLGFTNKGTIDINTIPKSQSTPEVSKLYDQYKSTDDKNLVESMWELKKAGDKYTQTPVYQALQKIYNERGFGNLYDEYLKITNIPKTEVKVDYGNYLNDKSSLNSGSIQKTLSNKIRYNGEVMTKKDYIEKLVSEGSVIKNGKLYNPTTDGYPIITKTEQNYAEYLLKNQSQSTPEVNKTNITKDNFGSLLSQGNTEALKIDKTIRNQLSSDPELIKSWKAVENSQTKGILGSEDTKLLKTHSNQFNQKYNELLGKYLSSTPEVSKTTNLLEEAKKYNSAEEFVDSYNKKLEGFNAFDNETDFIKGSKPIKERAKLHSSFMELSQKPEYQKIYENGGNDNDVLKQIWNQANKISTPEVSKTDSNLLTEAKKYNSAEEFVKANTLYHGTYDEASKNINKVGFQTAEQHGMYANGFEKFISSTVDENIAKKYAEVASSNTGKPSAVVKIDKTSLKIIDSRELPDSFDNIGLENKVRNMGYDAIDFSNDTRTTAFQDRIGGDKEVMIVNPKKAKILNESYLTDIWNQANKSPEVSPIKTGEIEPITAYHGSDIKFDNFDLNKVGTNTDSGMFGKGIYFSGNKKEAATYARKTGNVNEYQLNLKNPYIIRSQADIPNIQATGTKDYSEKFTKYLQDRGYDGVIDEISPNKQYVVFDPKQITSPIKTGGVSPLSPESKGIKQPTIKIKADSDQNLLNNQQGRLDTVKPEVSSSQKIKLSPQQPEQPKIKIKVGQTNQTSSGNLPQGIIPQTKLSDIENKVYGTETKLGDTGNKENLGFIGNKLRNAEIKANEVVSKGLTSQNKVVRGVATLFQDLFGGAGKSQEQLSQKSQFRGGTDYATKIAGDTQNYVYNLLNNDTKSLERVHAVLDPEISKIKVDEASLTANEKEALKMVREVSDFINDTNHRLGFISDELWQKNRGGKYLARAYETFDYPPEVADFIKNKSLKFDINPFKKRTEMTDWKKENAITDPAYLIGKRLQQTLFNSEVKKYTDWAMKSGLISDTQKAGYVQLSDSKAYGEAAGKWIRKDALEDIKGFFVSNDIGQKAYDILNWYDRNPLRRGQKMLKTVFNPAVRLGNRTGNYVFAWLNGINPVTFAKNRSWAKNAINSNDPIYRYAIQNGITGSDITKADITRISAELKRGVNDINTLQKINAWAKESYGRVDDVSKVAAFKTWLDRGVSPQEALNRTRRGFQDYNMVGMLYDLGAKIPILGNPFVRFASESIRITKNAAVDHPFRLVATLGAWKLFTDVMSRMSGEDEEDRKTRESRVGASHLPFTNISTNVQTPYGEINASRLLGFSSTFTPEDTGKLGSLGTDISKYAPFQNPLDARNYTNDPIIGPVISLATDKDFRGKSIADPKQNKYTGSLLTPGEQNLNRLGYAARSYLPPSFTDLYNIGASIQGKENVYGQVKTPLQSILRTYPGIKIEQFGPKEAEATRQRNADYNAYELDYIQKQINAVKKQQTEGKITPQQAQKRIDSLNREKITSQSDGERTFETSPEAPKDIMERISLATKATVTNPTNALKVIQAIFTEEKMRKLSGDTLIFERETNLNKTKEKGDAVDHIIPLSLGGDNSDKNKRYISAEANQEKAKLETSLARKLANGEITGSEARKQIKNYMEKYSDDYTLNTSTKSADKSTEETIGKIYTITNEKTGKDTEIDLTFPEYPELTGLTEADKALKSTYYSALSKIKTNAGKLYKAGKITAQEYNDLLTKVSNAKSKSGTGKKAKKITFKTSEPKALPKISLSISGAKTPTIKLKSAPTVKLSPTQSRKYTISA